VADAELPVRHAGRVIDVVVRPGAVLDRWRMLGYGGRLIRQYELFFLARVGVEWRPLGDVAAMHREDGIRATRWWTLAELDAAEETVLPDGLADLIRRLLG